MSRTLTLLHGSARVRKAQGVRSCQNPHGGYNHYTGPVRRNTGLPKPLGRRSSSVSPGRQPAVTRIPRVAVGGPSTRSARNELISKVCAPSADSLQGKSLTPVLTRIYVLCSAPG